jgi:hypothetical protein
MVGTIITLIILQGLIFVFQHWFYVWAFGFIHIVSLQLVKYHV